MFNPIEIEVWKDINCYDIRKDMYEVSNFGNIRNKFTNHILIPRLINSGYYTVYLRCDGVVRIASNFLVHRLVALAFIENTNIDYNITNHKNGDKTYNHDINLEWVDYSINTIHAIDNGLNNIAGENNKSAKLTEIQVIRICELLELNYSYNQILDEIQLEKTDNNRDMIGNIKRGISWTRISKNYNFSNVEYNFSNYTNDQIHQMCKYLENDKSIAEIYELIFKEKYINSTINKSFYEFLRKLRKKEIFINIATQYNY